jgi:hypothetical protein
MLQRFIHPSKMETAFTGEQKTLCARTVISALGGLCQQLAPARQRGLHLSRPRKPPGIAQPDGMFSTASCQCVARHRNPAILAGNPVSQFYQKFPGTGLKFSQ